jgi:hypothetical protein
MILLAEKALERRALPLKVGLRFPELWPERFSMPKDATNSLPEKHLVKWMRASYWMVLLR